MKRAESPVFKAVGAASALLVRTEAIKLAVAGLPMTLDAVAVTAFLPFVMVGLLDRERAGARSTHNPRHYC